MVQGAWEAEARTVGKPDVVDHATDLGGRPVFPGGVRRLGLATPGARRGGWCHPGGCQPIWLIVAVRALQRHELVREFTFGFTERRPALHKTVVVDNGRGAV